MNILTKG